MTVQNRIREYIKYEQLSITKFCDTIGVSNAYISSIVKSIQPDKIQRITFEYPKLNIEWLLTGNGEMIKEDVKSDVIHNVEPGIGELERMKIDFAELRGAYNQIKEERDDLRKENKELSRSLIIAESDEWLSDQLRKKNKHAT